MAQVGFAIFGRPHGQEVMSNGLFQEANLDSMLYLDGLTGGLTLKAGETVAIIKFLTDSNNKSLGVTVVSLFTYAESFGNQNRPGGFVGAAVCFKGLPNIELINKGLFALFNASKKLINPANNKFLSANKSYWTFKLPEATDRWFISGQSVSQVNIKEVRKMGIELNVPLEFGLFSCLQGVISNPIYNKFDTFLISPQESFIEKLKASGAKIYNVYQLLNYTFLHENLQKRFISEKSEIDKQLNQSKLKNEAEISALMTKEEEEKDKLNKLQASINKAVDKKRDLDIDANSLQNKLADQKVVFEKEREQIAGLKNEIELKKQEKNSLSSSISNRLEEALIDPQLKQHIRSEIEQEYNNGHEAGILNGKNEYRKKYIRIRKGSIHGFIVKPIVLVLISLFLFGAPLIVNWFLKGGRIRFQATIVEEPLPAVPKQTASTQIEKKQKPKDGIVYPKAPSSFGFKQYLTFEETKQKNETDYTKRYIDDFSKVYKQGAKSKEVDAFFNRNWHFAELLGSNTSLKEMEVTILKLESLYRKHFNLEEDWSFTNFSNNKNIKPSLSFLLPFKGKFEIEETNFRSSNRKKIINKYLKTTGNLYKNFIGKIDISENDILFHHFRWMVSRISIYKGKNRDIIPTTKKIHKVPLIK